MKRNIRSSYCNGVGIRVYKFPKFPIKLANLDQKLSLFLDYYSRLLIGSTDLQHTIELRPKGLWLLALSIGK